MQRCCLLFAGRRWSLWDELRSRADRQLRTVWSHCRSKLVSTEWPSRANGQKRKPSYPRSGAQSMLGGEWVRKGSFQPMWDFYEDQEEFNASGTKRQGGQRSVESFDRKENTALTGRWLSTQTCNSMECQMPNNSSYWLVCANPVVNPHHHRMKPRNKNNSREQEITWETH